MLPQPVSFRLSSSSWWFAGQPAEFWSYSPFLFPLQEASCAVNNRERSPRASRRPIPLAACVASFANNARFDFPCTSSWQPHTARVTPRIPSALSGADLQGLNVAAPATKVRPFKCSRGRLLPQPVKPCSFKASETDEWSSDAPYQRAYSRIVHELQFLNRSSTSF